MAKKKSGGSKPKPQSAGPAGETNGDAKHHVGNGTSAAAAGGGRGKAVAPLPAAALQAQVADKQRETADLSRQVDEAAEQLAASKADRKQLLSDRARLEERVRSLQAQLDAEKEAADTWRMGYRRASFWASANGVAFAVAGATAAALAYARYSTRTAA